MHEPSTEPVRVDTSAAVSTHISLLVLTGDRVLKFRRPVVTGFCDFTTIESRLHDCEREVELNRRLTDDLYLGVGRVEVAGLEPTEAEPCVVMRRLPQDRLLSRMVETGADLEGPVRAIARRLATFHDAALRATTSADDGVRAVRERWADAIAQLRPFVHDAADRGPSSGLLDEIESLASRWCAGRTALFRARLGDGFVRDGHGDLRAENIFMLDDGPRILDCIEFDDELRRIDVATDLAFLVMDLRRLGQAAAAETLVVEYERASGAAVPRGLLEHDVSYWALVRAKVAHLRATQGDPTAGAQAAELESLALGQLRRAQVRLVVVGGDTDEGRDGHETEIRRRVERLGLGHAVTFAGAQPQDRLREYYVAADATVLPSYYESFGMVALEAMACGSAVVASRVGGLQTTVRDGVTGLLVPEGDACALAGTIARVLECRKPIHSTT